MTDIQGNELRLGDKVYYSGASTSFDFAIGVIKEIVESEGKVYFGTTRWRYSNQVIKKI